MKLQVIGKAHLEGTSKKAGKPYNFNTVYDNGPDRGAEGLASLSLSLDPAVIPYNISLWAILTRSSSVPTAILYPLRP